MTENNNFAITVGRWTGLFSPVWYADVVHVSDDRPYMTFNAWTRRGAMKKATRYIRRMISPIEDGYASVYTYDEKTFTLEKIDV